MSGFLRGAWAGSAPLAVWSVHFAACYVGVAVACTADAPPATITAALAATTVAAVALGAWLVWRACAARRRHRGAPGDLVPTVRLVVAVLALVGLLWTALPLALLPPCGAG